MYGKSGSILADILGPKSIDIRSFWHLFRSIDAYAKSIKYIRKSVLQPAA